MRSGNPVLTSKSFGGFAGFQARSGARPSAGAMTIQGTVNKTALLLLLALGTAAFVWRLYFRSGDPAAAMPWMMIGLLGGLVAALVTVFKKDWAAFTTPAYALFEGLALGGISALFEARHPGIVLQAVGLTFGTLLALLVTYKTGAIRATENFKLGVAAATGGILLVYLVSFVLRLFGVPLGFLHEGSLVGIGFSLVVVFVAALNLVLDFDFIEQGAAQGAPKHMEWYGAFGLMVTLVWLYLELLRLLGKLRDRR
jgi:uncharacterized YccA/Bax inhibitor family protein